MNASSNPIVKTIQLLLLFVATVAVLWGGYLFLRDYKESKLVIALFAVAWVSARWLCCILSLIPWVKPCHAKPGPL